MKTFVSREELADAAIDVLLDEIEGLRTELNETRAELDLYLRGKKATIIIGEQMGWHDYFGPYQGFDGA